MVTGLVLVWPAPPAALNGPLPTPVNPASNHQINYIRIGPLIGGLPQASRRSVKDAGIAPIHGLQHHRICRRAARTDECFDQLLHHLPAACVETQHLHLSSFPRFFFSIKWTHHAAARRLHLRLSDSRDGGTPGTPSIRQYEAECRECTECVFRQCRTWTSYPSPRSLESFLAPRILWSAAPCRAGRCRAFPEPSQDF